MYLSSDEALRQLRHYPGTGGNYSGKRYEQNPGFSILEINMKLFANLQKQTNGTAGRIYEAQSQTQVHKYGNTYINNLRKVF